MSKKPKLKKGTSMNLQELTIDAGKKVVKDAVKDQGVLGQLGDFIDSPIGQRLVNMAIDLGTQYIANAMNPNPRRSSYLEAGSAEGAVKPRSALHEQVFKVLNSIPASQLEMIKPVLDLIGNPAKIQELMQQIDPDMLQTVLKSFLGGK